MVEILFWLEIVINFFAAYKNTETFESIYSLRKITKTTTKLGNRKLLVSTESIYSHNFRKIF